MTRDVELVIKKVKKVSGGEEGGSAWKIALADFMCALMIVFFTLWTTASKSDAEKAMLADYFKGEMVTNDQRLKLLEATYNEIREILKEQKVIITLDRNAHSITIKFDAEMLFKSGSDKLKSDAINTISTFANTVKTKGFFFHVYGYTDNVPVKSGAVFKHNLELSIKRATSAGFVLIDSGIGHDKITIHGEGALNPVKKNDSPQNMKANRRVEIYMTESSAPSKVYKDNVLYTDVNTAKTMLNNKLKNEVVDDVG